MLQVTLEEGDETGENVDDSSTDAGGEPDDASHDPGM